MRKSKASYKPQGVQYQGNNMAKAAVTGEGHKITQPRQYQSQQQGLSRQLFEQRRAAGLCYKCGEKYQPGHHCQSQTLYHIKAYVEPDEVFDEQLLQWENEEEETPEAEDEEEEVGISVHALSGQNPHDTIKVQGEVGNKNVTILIDTGSTHNFIDFKVAKEVKATMTTANPLIVTVADGHKVMSKLKCSNFQWTMQGENYQSKLRVIRLDGLSIILGIDWLRKYGRVTFDYATTPYHS